MTSATERRSSNRRIEDIYRKAIEDIRDYAIFMTDAAGLITNWNKGAQHVRLTVTDSGVGIAAEHLPHIFEQFRQVDFVECSCSRRA